MEQMHQRSAGAILMALLAAAAFAAGCDGESNGPGSGGSGGSGQSVASSSSHGAGGGGAGGGGGQGGAAPACLEPSTAAAFFTIADPAYCIVGAYDAERSGGVGAPSWGSHGGPLTLSRAAGSSSIELARWKLPTGKTGKLTSEVTPVEATLGAKVFVNDQAIDLPFFNWTAFSWANAFPMTDGEIVTVKGSTIAKRYPLNGPQAMAGIASDVDHGRLFVSGLSPLADVTTMTNGLHAADSCGTAASPDLLPGTNPDCKPPITVDKWGEASGPIAVDHDGNVFAIMTRYTAGDQEARGFAAPAIARGQGPVAGTPLFTLPGYGLSLAALAPQAGGHGKLLFQPNEPMKGEAQDVIAQAYSVSGQTLKAEGSPAVFLKLAKNNISLTLMRDDQDRLWVGAATATGSTFVVISRSP